MLQQQLFCRQRFVYNTSCHYKVWFNSLRVKMTIMTSYIQVIGSPQKPTSLKQPQIVIQLQDQKGRQFI